MIKKILFTFLCIFIGCVFLLSGFTKGGFPFLRAYSSPIEPFELTFVDLGVASWKTAPFIARLMIGFEFFIGLLLVFNIKLRKVAYRLGIFILAVFSIYLVMLMLFAGDKGNCGCFGTVFVMTPGWALIKNIIMLGVLFLLYKFHEGWNNKLATALLWASFLAAFSLPFIWNPVELNYSQAYLNRPADNYPLELDSLYNHATLNVPPRTLSQGKHIIAFMSLTCRHCRIASKKMRLMHLRNPSIPFYFVLNGDKENLKPYFDDTQTEDIPHCMLLGHPFIYLAGTAMPTILLVNNGIVEHDVNYMELDQSEIENWLKN